MRPFVTRIAMATFLGLAGCTTSNGGSALTEEVSAPAPFKSEDEFRQWFAFYYEKPTPERMTQALAFMSAQGYLKQHPDVASVFFGKVFAANQGRLTTWASQWQTLGPDEWSVLMVSLWLADSSEAKRVIAANAQHLPVTHRERFAELVAKDPKAKDLLKIAVDDPRQINLLWAAFSATGDARYVRKVVSYVPLYGGRSKGDKATPAHAVGETAIMSLANNVPFHKIVANVCLDENRTNANPKTRLLLQAMLKVLAEVQRVQGKDSAETAPAH